MINISVMVSGGGSNLQALIDGVADGRIGNARIVLVISNRSGIYALERAEKAGIRSIVIGKEEYPDGEERADAILAALIESQTDLVVTAGYTSIIHKKVCVAYAGHMINIHPALLPKFGGVGYYGMRIHREVLEAGEKESGATVHYVDDEGVDSGEIILQARVPVFESDTPETLQKRVLEEVEHPLIVKAANKVVQKLEEEKNGGAASQ